MGSRAMLSFTDDMFGAFNVYTHWNGGPVDVAKAIDDARAFAWPLPRFESNEFSAAFIAANKPNPGGLRIMASGDWRKSAAEGCPDIGLLYEVTCLPSGSQEQSLRVRIIKVSCGEDDRWSEEDFFNGSFEEFQARAADLEKKSPI